MNNGFYLAAYIEIDSYKYIVGGTNRHDQNISLWKFENGNLTLVHYWELERMAGVKQYSQGFFDIYQAKPFINNLLWEYKLSLDDMEEIWGSDKLGSKMDAMVYSVKKHEEFALHSIWHLYSCILLDTAKFYSSTIVGMALDFGPDMVLDQDVFKSNKYCYAGCVVQNGKIQLIPLYSPAPVWSYARFRYGLKEGTLMALVSASASELYIEDKETLLFDRIGDLEKVYGSIADYIQKLEKLIDSLNEKDKGIKFSGFDPKFTYHENKISMVMKQIQKMSYRILDSNIALIQERFEINLKDSILAVSGGFALNCPANSYLINKYGFKDFMAPPCINDSGLSLGMALYYTYHRCPDMRFCLKHAYYGNASINLRSVIMQSEFSEYIDSINVFEADQAAKDIIDYPVVWFQGKAEIGPRALGHRSILADPRNPASVDILNKIKQREWWRPVAPVILDEEGENWFEQYESSPFMLRIFSVKKECADQIPSILHLDKTARIQSVAQSDNPELHSVILAFYKQVGIPILCNTSLNDRGEPIIDTIEQAINFALRKKIKIMYINTVRIELKNHFSYHEKSPYPRALNYCSIDDRIITLMKNKINPHNLPEYVMQIKDLSFMSEQWDISNQATAQQLHKEVDSMLSRIGLEHVKHIINKQA